MKTLLFCVVIFFSLISSATLSKQCSCENPQITGSIWGPWTGQSECIGRCNDAVIRRNRSCFVNTELGTPRQVEQCSVTVKSDCGECNGEWGPWSNAGKCTVVCGWGVQKQHRVCYKKNFPKHLKIRTHECRGSNDVSEEFKNITCRRRSNCSSNEIEKIGSFPSATEGTLSTLTRILTLKSSTSAKEESSTNTGSSSSFPSVIANPVDEKYFVQANGRIDTITLAAILGSVTIICITVVAIAFAIVYIKKKDSKQNSMTDSTQSTTSFIKPGTKNLTDESSFTSLANANAHRPLPPTHVANPLYGNTLTNDDKNYESFETDTLPYEENRSSTATVYELDPIYVSMDNLT